MMAWEKDKLGRQEFGQHVLGHLVSRFNSRRSFIANLDAPWGQGKTFFLENLANQMREEGWTVAYVNAWRDDRTDDPLIAVLSAINQAIEANLGAKGKAAEAFSKARKSLAPVVVEVGKQVGKHALRLITGIGIDKVLDVFEQGDSYKADDGAIEKLVEGLSAEQVATYVEERLRSQELERHAIDAFRHGTAAALVASGIKLPLFVIIDELDRCRPTYAVQMLEELKHIFSIEGVVFLIGTDTLQLAHSVNALYGEKFDSERYLRRFFDRVIVFPPVERRNFVEAIVAQTAIEWKLFSNSEGVAPADVFISLFESKSYTNRDIEHFVEILDTFVASWEHDLPIEPISLAALIDDYREAPVEFAGAIGLIARETRDRRWTANGTRGSINLSQQSAQIVTTAQNDLRSYEHLSWPAPEYFLAEFNGRIANRHHAATPLSLINDYRSRILLSARIASDA